MISSMDIIGRAGLPEHLDGEGDQNGRRRDVSVHEQASVDFHASSPQCDEQKHPNKHGSSKVGNANEAIADAPEMGRGHNAPDVRIERDDAPEFIKDLTIGRVPTEAVAAGATPLSQGDFDA